MPRLTRCGTCPACREVLLIERLYGDGECGLEKVEKCAIANPCEGPDDDPAPDNPPVLEFDEAKSTSEPGRAWIVRIPGGTAIGTLHQYTKLGEQPLPPGGYVVYNQTNTHLYLTLPAIQAIANGLFYIGKTCPLFHKEAPSFFTMNGDRK